MQAFWVISEGSVLVKSAVPAVKGPGDFLGEGSLLGGPEVGAVPCGGWAASGWRPCAGWVVQR